MSEKSELREELQVLVRKSEESREDIAKKAGIAPSHLSQILRGTRLPSEQVTRGLARALGREDKTEALLEKLRTAREARQASKLSVNGVVHIHEAMPHKTFYDWIATANESVCILDTWISLPMRYRDAFLTAVKRNQTNPEFKIRILLIDPECEAARLRARDLWMEDKSEGVEGKDDKGALELMRKMAEEDTLESMRRTVTQFKVLSAVIMGHLQKEGSVGQGVMEVRFHDHLPSFSAHICDGRALMGFYTHGTVSDDAPVIEVHAEDSGGGGSALFQRIEKDFDILWFASFPKY